MKPLKQLCALICLLLCAVTALAQDKSSKEYYTEYYTGCWETDDTTDGYLVTWPDQSFIWVKPTGSLYGQWEIKSVYGIPVKGDVIVLKPEKGDKEKYEIGVTSMPAVIYLPGGHKFHKVECR